jgi:hypothetical protein
VICAAKRVSNFAESAVDHKHCTSLFKHERAFGSSWSDFRSLFAFRCNPKYAHSNVSTVNAKYFAMLEIIR